MNKTLLLISLLVVGAVLSACGGSGDSTPEPIHVTATPRPETIAQLSATVPATEPPAVSSIATPAATAVTTATTETTPTGTATTALS